ncbi:MAG: sugar phosphate isomerase [Rhodospirillaceae bacterium]|nr:sugar phosphate isomerase [Rhodospirillaceae bacterium]|tara:strand:+ start:1739 stop:2623 length:885 start_codon:yes stop_codon:yes gene_type:complete
MYLTGFADEASQDVRWQIKATNELGWNAIEARNIGGSNIHDISDEDFRIVCEFLDEAEIKVNCFGSAIANWSKQISDPFEITIAEVERTIPRMQTLDTELVRIMSFARCVGEEQYKKERFRRLREICARFGDAGIIPVHENCMNYGGMSWLHSLELIDNVPGLKLVFDTGNPIVSRDFAKPDGSSQDSIEFFKQVREHVAYIHIKDATLEGQRERFLYPGEGHAEIPKILKMLKDSNYQGGISIEPHMASVFHDPHAVESTADASYAIYIEYGKRLMSLLKEIEYEPSLYSRTN